MTTGAEVASGVNAFSVTAGIAILTGLAPDTAPQGQTLDVAITGADKHFQPGVTTASFGGDITVNVLTVSSATSAVANITVGTTAAVGLRTVTLSTLGEAAQRVNGFTVQAGTPVLTSVTPGAGRQGESVSVTVLGQFTTFQQGVTVADFGAGVSVDALAVTSPTSATVSVTIDPITVTGPRTVRLTTGTEIASGGSFTVSAGTAVLTRSSTLT